MQKTPIQEILNYQNSESVNQSYLKKLIMSPNEIKESRLIHQEVKHFVQGDALDSYLLREDFDDSFYISNYDKKPSLLIMSMVKECLIRGVELGSEASLDIINEHSYQPNWKDVTKINKLEEEGKDYYEELIKSKEKQIISVEEYELTIRMAESLRNSNVTGKYFDLGNPNIQTQVPIYFSLKHRGELIDCKALLDIVYTEKNGTITPIDLKTTMLYKLSEFRNAVLSYKYHWQAAWYKSALCNKHEDKVINPFKFIVESKVNIGNPAIFTMHDKDLVAAWKGFTNSYHIKDKGKPSSELTVHSNAVPYAHKGINDALDLYLFYKNNNFDYSLDIELFENNYDLQLNLFDAVFY